MVSIPFCISEANQSVAGLFGDYFIDQDHLPAAIRAFKDKGLFNCMSSMKRFLSAVIILFSF
jgi:hypothetical protein